MELPLTEKYRALCQREKDLNELLMRLMEEDKIKSGIKSHKKRKQMQEMEIEGKESPLINFYKMKVKQVNVASTANVISEEKQISSIRTAELERLYDKNVLKQQVKL